MKIEPRDQLFAIADRGNPFVRDRREHSAADQNLLARIALSVGLGRASKQTVALRPKTGERLIDRLKTGAHSLRISA